MMLSSSPRKLKNNNRGTNEVRHCYLIGHRKRGSSTAASGISGGHLPSILGNEVRSLLEHIMDGIFKYPFPVYINGSGCMT